jgi:hypothetical protein
MAHITITKINRIFTIGEAFRLYKAIALGQVRIAPWVRGLLHDPDSK